MNEGCLHSLHCGEVDLFNRASVEVTDDVIPHAFTLEQNYPNPFNPTTNITYEIPRQGFVSIRIYDNLGQEVRSLVERFEEPGVKSVTWDGKNRAGNPVASGVYFCRMNAGGLTKSQKMILAK